MRAYHTCSISGAGVHPRRRGILIAQIVTVASGLGMEKHLEVLEMGFYIFERRRGDGAWHGVRGSSIDSQQDKDRALYVIVWFVTVHSRLLDHDTLLLTVPRNPP
jgi:hypothetical protein